MEQIIESVRGVCCLQGNAFASLRFLFLACAQEGIKQLDMFGPAAWALDASMGVFGINPI